ncbi:MAG: DUF3060 domain-containing protein [Oscillospiraceae bacterium]|jgi:lipoprotein-anchoring transpeptidase ErfK/SrfK|nr:DUF3060 domain-containing protein [Oscillospiraceae bacterium]
MKRKKLVSAVLGFILLVCLSTGALAAQWADFTDISGHWAEQTLKKGFDDGLIAGMSDTVLAPDAPITAAQMITVLCRVLGAQESADSPGPDVPPDAWYADAAARAFNLGLISASPGDLDAPMTRQNALAMLAKAFSLVPAEPELSVLAQYSDAEKLDAANKKALAALVSEGLVQGFGGALNVSGSITRAEFLTVLYRVAENYIPASALVSGAQGGSVIRDGGALSHISAGKLWFGCPAESVYLTGIKAGTVTLRGHHLKTLSLSGSTLSALVADIGAGSVSIGRAGEKIGLVRLAACTSADIGAGADAVEITGSGIAVSIAGAHSRLVITGSGNTVTLAPGASVALLRITGGDNTVTPADDDAGQASAADIALSGSGNTVVCAGGDGRVSVGGRENGLTLASGASAALTVSGEKARVAAGALSENAAVTVSGNENAVSFSAGAAISLEISGALNVVSADGAGTVSAAAVPGDSNWIILDCAGLQALSVSGKYNTVTFGKTGAGQLVSAVLSGGWNALSVSGESTLGYAEIKGAGNTVTVGGTAETITISGRKTVLKGGGSVKNLTVGAGGCSITLRAENVTDDSARYEEARVLALVTLGYKGNYTLSWAETHDYEDFEKEIWINAKGYSSATGYLIWVNLAMQRVNIFTGSAGDWTLLRSSIVGTGASGTGTPAGVWRTTYKSWSGWTTGTYTVKPVVGFRENTGYAFHSRLYYPGTSRLSDSSIGFPISHGCVRMYDEDILYIYDNIPVGTTVVVY